MAIREIIKLPDKQLRLVSRPVEKVTVEIRRLADDMFETMYDAPGIGLAAIQVAQPLRLITMDLFVDYLSKLKRDRVMKRFAKAAKRAVE
jgi:peptide deformylase